MKIRLLLALVGLAISFALPTLAQQKDTPDPQLRQALLALAKKFEEAFLKGDAAAVASFFTEDAVLVNDTGPVYGRPAIEKYYADMFQILHYFSHDTTYDPTSPHPIGTDGNGVWENGEWSSAIAPKVRTVALDESGATLDRLKSVRAILGRSGWRPIT
jgi:hypothetical protein